MPPAARGEGEEGHPLEKGFPSSPSPLDPPTPSPLLNFVSPLRGGGEIGGPVDLHYKRYSDAMAAPAPIMIVPAVRFMIFHSMVERMALRPREASQA